MAFNLFTKTFLAHETSSTSLQREMPSFLICEADKRRADEFVRDLREKGGIELASRVQSVGSGRECVAACY
jgi:3-hydroxyisobutyrate dehydrogenase